MKYDNFRLNSETVFGLLKPEGCLKCYEEQSQIDMFIKTKEYLLSLPTEEFHRLLDEYKEDVYTEFINAKEELSF